MQHKLEFNILKSNSFCSQMLRVFSRGILILILLTFVSTEIQLFTILGQKAICVQTFLKSFNFPEKKICQNLSETLISLVTNIYLNLKVIYWYLQHSLKQS